jgi:hypothetical protein
MSSRPHAATSRKLSVIREIYLAAEFIRRYKTGASSPVRRGRRYLAIVAIAVYFLIGGEQQAVSALA